MNHHNYRSHHIFHHKQPLALLLAAILLCTSCSRLNHPDGTDADIAKTDGSSLTDTVMNLINAGSDRLTATTMSLTKTEGTVNILSDKGKTIPPADGMKLYSGYGMNTQPVSYAWLNLDRVKLVKMDENSEIDIQKKKHDLEIFVRSGALFFHVAEPLDDDETMNIRTSTMLVGIRGTCGWVNAESDTHAQVYLLEGKVTVTATSGGGEEVTVSAGEMAEITVTETGETEITVTGFPETEVPGFILTELEQDDELSRAILEASGLDVLNPPSAAELAREAYDRVLDEYRRLPYVDIWSGQWENIDWDAYRYIHNGLVTFDNKRAGYAYYDIDKNGTEELFVGSYEGYLSGFRWNALYTFDGTDAVSLAMQVDEGSYEILQDGMFLLYSNGGVIDKVYRINADTCALEQVTDSDIPTYNPDDERTWEASYIEPNELTSHGGVLTPLLEWTPLDGVGDFILTEQISFGDVRYVGSYINDETGTTLDISFNGSEYTMFTPRPGDPAHADSYTLRPADMGFELVDWQTGSILLTLSPHNGSLAVSTTGIENFLEYLNGYYRRR